MRHIVALLCIIHVGSTELFCWGGLNCVAQICHDRSPPLYVIDGVKLSKGVAIYGFQFQKRKELEE